MLCDFTAVLNFYFFIIAPDKIHTEFSNFLCKREIRLKNLHGIRFYIWHVDGVFHRETLQGIDDLLGYRDGNINLGFFCGCSKVRRQNNAVKFDKRAVKRWLFHENIYCCTAYDIIFYCFCKRFFINDTSSCAVNNARSLLHNSKFLRADKVFCFFCEGCMYGNIICPFNYVYDSCKLNTKFISPLRRNERVISKYIHLHSLGAFCYFCADPSKPYHTKNFLPYFNSHEFFLSHFLLFNDAFACGMFLDIAIIMAIVCSAAEMVLPSGAFTTIIPFSMAALTLILST